MASKRELAWRDFPSDPEIKDVVEDILYPYKSTRPATVAIQFGVPRDKEDEWTEAVQFASVRSSYTTTKIGRLTKHRVEFEPSQASDIFRLYTMLEKSPHLEIFINGIRLPYAATLWLPLLWFYL